jgi:hypothetical protein
MPTAGAVRPPPQARFRPPAAGAWPAVPDRLYTTRDAGFLRLAAWTFVVLMVARLSLSDPFLNQFFNYTDEGGMILEKIHPATYGMLALLVAMLARLKFFLNVQEARLVTPMFAMIGIIILLVGFMMGLGRSVSIGYLLETYIAGCLIAFMLMLFPVEYRRWVGNAVLIYVVVNAGLAIVEKVLGIRLLPYPYVEISFRPTALTSHPLVIGLINAGSVVFILATRWPGWVKTLAMMLVVMGTFAAGARTGAIFASFAAFTALLFTPMPGHTPEKRARSAAILFGGMAMLAPILFVIASSAGFLERFEGGYIDENAQARIDVYKVFDWVSWPEIFFGSDIVAIKKMVMDRLGILVESSVVVFVFQFGLFGALLFVGCLLWMMLRAAAGADRRAYIGIFAFFATAMSNDALSGKHCYILMMLVLLLAFRNDTPDAYGRIPRRNWQQA